MPEEESSARWETGMSGEVLEERVGGCGDPRNSACKSWEVKQHGEL